jgi:hypothetical protein
MLARIPSLVDATYAGDEAGRESLRQRLIDGQSNDADRQAVQNVLYRLTHDHALVRLLGANTLADPLGWASSQSLAETALEPAAICEFNRIMWEPRFVTHPPDGDASIRTPSPQTAPTAAPGHDQ